MDVIGTPSVNVGNHTDGEVERSWSQLDDKAAAL